MSRRRYGDTVTVVRAPIAQDSYTGNESRDWANATRTQLAADVQPLSEQELNDRRQVSITRWSVIGEPGDISATDRIEWRGETFDIDGEVGRFTRRGIDHHLEFTLQRFSE